MASSKFAPPGRAPGGASLKGEHTHGKIRPLERAGGPGAAGGVERARAAPPAEIARRCGVREAVLLRLGAALPRRGGGPARDRARRPTRRWRAALLRRALGYRYTEVVEEENGGGVKRRETHKYEPPNITAIKLWLSCRLPEKWGARVGEADAQDRLDALLAALDAQAGGEEAP